MLFPLEGCLPSYLTRLSPISLVIIYEAEYGLGFDSINPTRFTNQVLLLWILYLLSAWCSHFCFLVECLQDSFSLSMPFFSLTRDGNNNTPTKYLAPILSLLYLRLRNYPDTKTGARASSQTNYCHIFLVQLFFFDCNSQSLILNDVVFSHIKGLL
jgi:hypothetical protein